MFTTRPLSKIELLKLKAKDLIFYLQSKHISTTGCVGKCINIRDCFYYRELRKLRFIIIFTENLISYLISVCSAEKEELVNLVLIHVDNASPYSPNSHHSSAFSNGSGENQSNPFDQLKNTCQNLFTTFTEKIAADLNFDLKPTQSDRQPNVCEDQPRYTRQFRYQSSYGGSGGGDEAPHATPTSGDTANANRSSGTDRSQSNLSSPLSAQGGGNSLQSPTTTSSGSSSPSVFQTTTTNARETVGHVHPTPEQIANRSCTDAASSTGGAADGRKSATRLRQAKRNHLTSQLLLNDACATGSGCECSDDEMIMKFQQNYREQPSEAATKVNAFAAAGPSGSTSSSTQTGNSSDTPLKEDGTAMESSDVSSFEDLGAVGGCVATTSSDADNWQIVNRPANSDETPSASSEARPTSSSILPVADTTVLPNAIADTESDMNQRQFAMKTHSNNRCDTLGQLKFRSSNRKIVRRRSDGIVYMPTSSNATRNLYKDNFREDSSAGIDADNDDDDESSSVTIGSSSTSGGEMSRKRTKKSCRKCGKTKGDLKKYIARFRRQLETKTDSSEAEIKQQLEAFLKFLESRSRSSMDGKDDSPVSIDSPTMAGELERNSLLDAMQRGEIIIDDYDDDGDDDDDDFDDDAGIHVYGTDEDVATNQTPTRQFFNLHNIGSR